MREILSDVLKQVHGLASVVKVTGSNEQTRFQAVDDKKTLVIDGIAKAAITGFEGEFGLSNLSLLQGLLDFASYRTDESSLNIKRRDWKGSTTVEQIEFRDAKGLGADFRCMAPEAVPDQATLTKISWDIEFVPDRGKLAEFQKLVTLCKEVDENFTLKVEDGNLVFTIGTASAATHRASMAFHEVGAKSLRAPLQFNSAQFLKLLSVGGTEGTLAISDRGLLSVSCETEHGSYRYYLRAVR